MLLEAASALSATLKAIDIPSVVLFGMLLMMVWLMERAQRRTDFDWGQAFQDETGKVTVGRIGAALSLAFSSWFIVYIVMNGMHNSYDAAALVLVLDSLFKYFMAYIGVWSGAKIAEKIVDAYIWKFMPDYMSRPLPKAPEPAEPKA